MFNRNIGSKERGARVVGGALMILCGLFGLGASAAGWVVACVGAVGVVTGLVQYCPACALAGRKSI